MRLSPRNLSAETVAAVALERELHIWRRYFNTGADFLRDLGALGFRQDDDPGKLAAARDAWRRLGAEHLRRWPICVNGELPWALKQFGRPPESA